MILLISIGNQCVSFHERIPNKCIEMVTKYEFWFDHFQVEFGAHTWRLSSPDEYFNICEYGCLTPTGLAKRVGIVAPQQGGGVLRLWTPCKYFEAFLTYGIADFQECVLALSVFAVFYVKTWSFRFNCPIINFSNASECWAIKRYSKNKISWKIKEMLETTSKWARCFGYLIPGFLGSSCAEQLHFDLYLIR